MRSRADTLEKFAGRRATTCLGGCLLTLALLVILALLWSAFFKKSPLREDKARQPPPPLQS
jgi:hypothetical protein